MEPKKKKRTLSPMMDPMHFSRFDFGEIDFIVFLGMRVIDYDASTTESERLHLLEPP